MSTVVHKVVSDPGRIAILFPTRGRPDSVRRLLHSIAATVRDASRVEVWAWVDEDDLPTRACFDSAPFPAHAVVGPSTDTNGDMYNLLRERCDSGPGIYMIGSDKMVFNTPGWDTLVRDAFARHPDGIHYAFPRDSVNRGSFGAFYFLGAGWANVIGRLMTTHFPFWYDDLWTFSVANLVGRIDLIDMDVELVAGPTIRMHNLFFWDRFFQATEPERVDEAKALILRSADPRLERLAATVDRTPTHLTRRGREKERDANLLSAERHFSTRLQTDAPRPPIGSQYRIVEDRAVEHLLSLRRRLTADREGTSVHEIEDAVAHSSLAADLLARDITSATEAGDLTEANALTLTYITRFPLFPDGYLVWCDQLFALGDLTSARSLLLQMRSIFTGDSRVHERWIRLQSPDGS